MTFVVNEHYFHIRRMAVERNPRSRRMFLLEKECRVLNAKRSSVTRLSWTGLLFNLNTTLRLLAFPPLKTTAIWTNTALLCRHFEDLHQPGEFPCPGDERICGKVFTSRNKMSSHYSRYQGSWNKKNLNCIPFQELQPKQPSWGTSHCKEASFSGPGIVIFVVRLDI